MTRTSFEEIKKQIEDIRNQIESLSFERHPLINRHLGEVIKTVNHLPISNELKDPLNENAEMYIGMTYEDDIKQHDIFTELKISVLKNLDDILKAL